MKLIIFSNNITISKQDLIYIVIRGSVCLSVCMRSIVQMSDHTEMNDRVHIEIKHRFSEIQTL